MTDKKNKFLGLFPRGLKENLKVTKEFIDDLKILGTFATIMCFAGAVEFVVGTATGYYDEVIYYREVAMKSREKAAEKDRARREELEARNREVPYKKFDIDGLLEKLNNKNDPVAKKEFTPLVWDQARVRE